MSKFLFKMINLQVSVQRIFLHLIVFFCVLLTLLGHHCDCDCDILRRSENAEQCHCWID